MCCGPNSRRCFRGGVWSWHWSNFIQVIGVESHVIVELHPQVCTELQRWASHRRNVTAINDSWQHHTEKLEAESFDGILFDTYPLRQSQLHRNHFEFFHEASRLLKPSGVFTYYSDEETHISAEHQRMLLRYFSEFAVKIVQVSPPSNCQYWRASTMAVIVARKGNGTTATPRTLGAGNAAR